MFNIFRQLLKKIRNLFLWTKSIIKNNDKSAPIYPPNNSSGIKVHLGPGEINLQGWVNIDAREFSHTHIKTNKLELEEFSDGTVSEIYLCHVLEHFSFDECNRLLNTFYTKLKIGGVLKVSVPDFSALVDIYINNNKELEDVKNALMGGQDYEYNFHKSVFNKKFLLLLFGDVGFKNLQEWNTKEEFGQSIGDWSDYAQKTKKRKVKLSLNIKGIKS